MELLKIGAMSMKKFFAFLLCINFMAMSLPAFALSEEESEHLRDMRVQPSEPANAPQWVDYAPSKYENPRTDFKKGTAIAEFTVGILLTDLLLTAPIGIPMICHAVTKFKNIGYAKKKAVYFEGLEEVKNIPEAEQEEYYANLLKKAKMKKKHID